MYRKHIRYHFDVDGETLSIDGVEGSLIEISETRFNGQEDTHMYGSAEFVDGKWIWVDDCENFSEYQSQKFADNILKYINENPPPIKVKWSKNDNAAKRI